jgi:hypothetical protein
MLKQKIEKDVKWGLKKEQHVLPLLQSKIKDVRKTEDKYDCFDFRSDELKIDLELKSRNIYKGQYETIFFGLNKLEEGRTRRANGTSLRTIYLFRFKKKKNPSKHVVYFWEDDGIFGKTTMNGNLANGEKRKELVDLPCSLLKPLKLLSVE